MMPKAPFTSFTKPCSAGKLAMALPSSALLSTVAKMRARLLLSTFCRPNKARSCAVSAGTGVAPCAVSITRLTTEAIALISLTVSTAAVLAATTAVLNRPKASASSAVAPRDTPSVW